MGLGDFVWEEWVNASQRGLLLMTRSISVLSVLCLALLTLPFAAVANAQAANADMNARLAAASDLIDAMGGRQSVIDQINRVIPAQMQALQAQFPDLTV